MTEQKPTMDRFTAAMEQLDFDVADAALLSEQHRRTDQIIALRVDLALLRGRVSHAETLASAMYDRSEADASIERHLERYPRPETDREKKRPSREGMEQARRT